VLVEETRRTKGENTRVHPPPFRYDHKLSDWPDCWLEMRCRKCNGRSAVTPMKLLIRKHGDRTFLDLIPRLRCSQCRSAAAPVYLCASPQRTGGYGGPGTDWAIEIVPENELRAQP
jgi:hypothetical protein